MIQQKPRRDIEITVPDSLVITGRLLDGRRQIFALPETTTAECFIKADFAGEVLATLACTVDLVTNVVQAVLTRTQAEALAALAVPPIYILRVIYTSDLSEVLVWGQVTIVRT